MEQMHMIGETSMQAEMFVRGLDSAFHFVSGGGFALLFIIFLTR
jgi:hypothetical protein